MQLDGTVVYRVYGLLAIEQMVQLVLSPILLCLVLLSSALGQKENCT